jgi:hypothetical protein
VVKRLLMVATALSVLTFVSLFAVGTASAQGPTPTPPTPWGRAWGGICNGYAVVSEAVTKLLGMTAEQIYAERTAGKTLSDIAKSKGITDQKLIDAMLAGQKSAIDQAVKDGRLTQAQADWMLEKMKAMAPFKLTNPFGPGMRGGGHGRWSAVPPTTTK